jgi:hypothetical protein
VRRIEGYVIVSADGMLADANGQMPASIRNDADQHFFQASLDRAAAIVHGRHSHEGGPRAGKRKRLVLTRQVAAIAPDTEFPDALRWNPMGASFDQALRELGLPPFTEVGPNATPEDVLARHGLKPGPRRDLDAAAGVSVVEWTR